MKVRTWIGELLSRSLLLGNAAGVHLHGACVDRFPFYCCLTAADDALLDIMLGFLRSRLDKQEMMMQQRKAVSGILRWCESQDEVKVTGNTVQAAAGEHLDWVRVWARMACCARRAPAHLTVPLHFACCRAVPQSRSPTSHAARARSGASATHRRQRGTRMVQP